MMVRCGEGWNQSGVGKFGCRVEGYNGYLRMVVVEYIAKNGGRADRNGSVPNAYIHVLYL
jgi:hypothetical protein